MSSKVSNAIGYKEAEIKLRRADLRSGCYHERREVWEKDIKLLEQHLAELKRYSEKGGLLELPFCVWYRDSKEYRVICTAAYSTGYRQCLIAPRTCLYSYRDRADRPAKVQERML